MQLPGRFELLSKAGGIEWPTWAMLATCYTIWLASIAWHDVLGAWWMLPAAVMVTLHSSLQHEALHGHPTRSAALNEALVFPALGLFVPYRSFRDTHLRHHNDANLTDPYDDPESWYLPLPEWNRAGSLRRRILNLNNTLAGRLVLGPALGLAGFWRSEWRQLKAGDSATWQAWALHLAGAVPVLGFVVWAGVPVWQYVAAAYLGMSVLMIRTFIEHRACETTPQRTAVVEAGVLMRLLFLNNNYHAVHHNHANLAWYKLPALWRAERARTLDGNGHYHYPQGYLQVARHWLVRQREPVAHPFMRRDPHVRPDLDPSPPSPPRIVPARATAPENL
jgi:fatty acid desaturase